MLHAAIDGEDLNPHGANSTPSRGKRGVKDTHSGSRSPKVLPIHSRDGSHGRQLSRLPELSGHPPVAAAFGQRQSRRQCYSLDPELERF